MKKSTADSANTDLICMRRATAYRCAVIHNARVIFTNAPNSAFILRRFRY